MTKINTKSTLGDIVAAYPSTVKVMNKYKIDYCCGGKDTLEKAANALSLDSQDIAKELEAETNAIENQDIIDWTKESTSQVIDYIVSTHHAFMNSTLEELNILTRKILKVHYKTDGETLLVVHKLFGTLKTELEAHLIKEEENLFPLIRLYEKTKNIKDKEKILKFIADTEDEHDAAGDLFKALEAATNDFTAPPHACYSYRRTFELLDSLEKDAFNHIHMENSILFNMI